MGKGYAAGVTTAAGLDEQQRYFAVAIGYSTPMRITNYDRNLTIPAGSGNTFYPFAVDVLEPGINSDGSQVYTVVIANMALDGVVGTLTGKPAALDWAQDSRGKTVSVYECTVTSGGRVDTLVFSGYVDEFSASDDSATCRIRCEPKEMVGTRPGSNYCMSICRWRKFKGDDCQFDGAATACSRTLADCRRKISAATFDGSGLDDMTTSGSFTGTSITQYVVTIDGTGTPDTFEWSNDGGATTEDTGVAISASGNLLENGVTVQFAATTGHTNGDSWSFQASWEDYFGNLVHAPAAGDVINVNGTNIQVPQSWGGPSGWAGPIVGGLPWGSPSSTLDPPPPNQGPLTE